MNAVDRKVPRQVAGIVDALSMFGSWSFTQPPVDVTGDDTADRYLAGVFSSLTRVRDTDSWLAALESRCHWIVTRNEDWTDKAAAVMRKWHADIYEEGMRHG